MAKPAIQIEGAREVRRAFKEAGAMKNLKDAHKEVAAVVVRDAVVLVPRRSGALAKSIRAAGLQSGAEVRAGSARVPYAGVIHFGWPTRGAGRAASGTLKERRAALRQLYEGSGLSRRTVNKAARLSAPRKGKQAVRGGPIRPNPFLYKAIDRRRGDILKVYERRVNEVIARTF